MHVHAITRYENVQQNLNSGHFLKEFYITEDFDHQVQHMQVCEPFNAIQKSKIKYSTDQGTCCLAEHICAVTRVTVRNK